MTPRGGEDAKGIKHVMEGLGGLGGGFGKGDIEMGVNQERGCRGSTNRVLLQIHGICMVPWLM